MSAYDRWTNRLRGLGSLLGGAGAQDTAGDYGRRGVAELFGRSPEVMDVADEVATEQRGRVVMLDRDGELARWLLGRLRGLPPIPPFQDAAREGFFSLVRLEADEDDEPAGAEDAETVAAAVATAYANGGGYADEYAGRVGHGYGGRNAWYAEAPYARRGHSDADDAYFRIEQEALDADLLLYLVAEDGWCARDARLYARLRTLAIPVAPVVLCTGPAHLCDCDHLRAMRQVTGVEPCVVSTEPDADLMPLVERILALRPRLAVPLAQEAPFCRRAIATRVIRTGALMTALIGAEPIPLLDLPLHVAVQWKVALQLAAIFGRPGLDVRSREMAGTVAVNLGARYLAQQLVKLVPGVGFILSGAISGISTLLLGHALLRFYENDRLWDWQSTTEAWHEQAARAGQPVRRAAAAGAGAVKRHATAALAAVRGITRRPAPALPQEIQVTEVSDVDAMETRPEDSGAG